MQGKVLKFHPDRISLILSGEKNSTWRLWDDKGLVAGDIVDLLRRDTLESIGRAELTSVIEKPFAQLTAEDKIRNGTFCSGDELYESFTRMYKREVGPETIVKVVSFKLL